MARIVADVRRDGDAALRDYGRRIDGVALESLVAGRGSDRRGLSRPCRPGCARRCTWPRIASGLSTSGSRGSPGWSGTRSGGALGQIIRPLQRVGVYAPGGTAAYPSSLLMAAIPAQVAGVEEIVVTTPPREKTGPV